MARAKRHYIPGHVWHITHRCHKRAFLLKFAKDRSRWIEWLYQAKKRYLHLSVLDYMVTSNHIHLLLFDAGGNNVIPDSIKLVAGKTGQEYNLRKNRKGAFWQDRYHATAVESNRHLRQCIAYIDMNMVRAGVVDHPKKWQWCGYNEIQNPRKRKGIIDFDRLTVLLGFGTYEQLKDSHFKWIDSAIQDENTGREVKWSQSIAVGSEAYIKKIKETLGFRVRGRKIRQVGDAFELRETLRPYGSADFFEADNTHLWDWQR
ncbi:transposase [Desulfosarcina ovata subsp. sediminis]|uniref:Transposase n=1 Tax=Desulfosarcina ovata subsp. sediminis TaxID=885957 RepID=A0A5K7ZJP5_9BACT|nr:transposase [Desulfosarcina ovata]BBO80445.1 transposase [Desulfosarcina ovata subsp. sediminis]